jgi:hypothetical protein
VTDVSYISALNTFCTFLIHLTQKQLLVVCAQLELPKCGTKEKLTRNIVRKVNSVLDKQVLGRCAQGQLQEKATSDFEFTEVRQGCSFIVRFQAVRQETSTSERHSKILRNTVSRGATVDQ